MAGMSGGSEQTLPVEPPVHVETFATHWTCIWKAGPLAQFLHSIGGIDSLSQTTRAIVDDTVTGGRERHRVTDIEVTETVRYLRLEPETPWTISWERRTWPVVSVSGTPPPVLCRRLHLQTTDCDGWADDVVRTLTCALPDQ
jgi:hypothetical protein